MVVILLFSVAALKIKIIYTVILNQDSITLHSLGKGPVINSSRGWYKTSWRGTKILPTKIEMGMKTKEHFKRR